MANEVNATVLSPNRRGNLLGVLVLTLAITLLAYRGWLGWDERRTRVPGTSDLEGPYEPWQVVGLAVTLIALAAGLTWFRRGWAAVVIPMVLTVIWSVDAATDPSVVDANLWPVGAGFLAVGTLLGAFLVYLITEQVRRASSFRQTPPDIAADR